MANWLRMPLTVEGDRTPSATVLLVNGRVDGDSAHEFQEICLQWIRPGDLNLLLDMSGVEYLSSAGLSAVLCAGKAMDAQGGRLLLCGLPGRLKQLFTFSGFDALFPIFESRDAALASCAK